MGSVRKFIKITQDGFVYLNCDHIVSVECHRNRFEEQPESNIVYTMDNGRVYTDVFDSNEEYDEFIDTVLDELYGHITG